MFSVPIYDYAVANEELNIKKATEEYYPCCGKTICKGCIYSFVISGNHELCPYCKADTLSGTDEEEVEKLMKRVEKNDAGSICVLASYYLHGIGGLQQDAERAMELWKQAADLGHSQAHSYLGNEYHQQGDMKKARFHYEAAAMAGHEGARNNLAAMEGISGNTERAVKHYTIAASAGHHIAMQNLLVAFKEGSVNRCSMDSILTAYNNSCGEFRSEARDHAICAFII
jgi:TPR repeat protein